jgi:phage tail-like protein
MYPVGFYFKLSFKGDDTAFQEVSGISKELHLEEVIGGGENRFKYRLPNISTSSNLVLKRGLVTKGSKLVDWCAATMDNGLIAAIETHDVSVTLMNEKGNSTAMWTFYNAYPVKYAVSDFKSQENSIVIESIELAFTYFDITEDTSFTDLFAQ